MQLRLIRHGETVANREGRFQGQSDYPLSEVGIEQVARLGEWLASERIDALYSSDLTRAYETAQWIARYHQLPVKTRADAREVKLGRFEQLTAAEIKARFPETVYGDLLSCGYDDVEQADQVYRRALALVDDLVKHHLGEHVVLVSHGTFISCLLLALLKISWPGKRLFVVGNTSMSTIKFKSPTDFVILGINEQPHLTAQRGRLSDERG